MAIPSIQNSFAAGELSPSLYGHVEFAKYAIGASTMRNFFVSYRGGAFSRPGTEFVGYSKQTVNNIASGRISFPTNPVVGQEINLNGVVWTFVASGAVGTEFNIAGNAGGTLALAVIKLNNAPWTSNPLLNGATYSDSGGSTSDDLIITWKTSGPAGNSYHISADAPATVSGPYLTGGGNTPPRLITFQFSLNQGLVLEFGARYMRVISLGAFVTETAGAITGITRASPAVVTQVAHGYTTGDWVFIDDVSGMTEVNGRTFVISVSGVNSYNLLDVFGVNVDSSAYTVYSSGGTGARIYELETPYDAVDLPFLKFTQSADVMTLCLVNQQTLVEYDTYDLARLADNNWTLTALDTAPPIAPPTGLVGVANTTSGISGMTDYQYVVTAIDPATGRESIASNIADIPNSVDISAVAGSINLVWDPVAGAQYYRIYKAPPAYNSTVPAGSFFGFAGDTFGVEFVDGNIAQDMLTVPPLHLNPFLRGQAVSVTITSPGSSLIGPITFTISPTPSDVPTGFGIIIGGALVAFVFTDYGGGMTSSSTIAFSDAGGTVATGNIEFSGSGNPANGNTITLNGRVFTFVNDNSGWPNSTSNHKINIGANLGGTMFFLEQALTTSTTYLADTTLNVATYAAPGTALNITYLTSGVVGNAYTLAASAATRSGATLTGGTGGVVPTGTLEVGPVTGTWPSVPAYFQQRRVYASTLNNPDTYWMSQPGDFNNFDSRIPTIDSDAIVGTPWSVQVNGIQFMLPLLGSLIMLTGQAAYQVSGSGGSPTNPQAITPSSQQAVPQAYNGCHFHVPPVAIDYDIYY
ncbi:MAG: ubiquitin-activating E1 FCCH domain-containing protein, partial [Alphaproteobacteria bacterium]